VPIFKLKVLALLSTKIISTLRASTDGVAFCDGCSHGCVDITCPYCVKENEIEQILELKSSMLKAVDGAIKLKRNHSYYYQVQTKIHALGTKYADFVVWTQEIFVTRTLPDSSVWSEILLKSKNNSKRHSVCADWKVLFNVYHIKHC